MAYGDLLIIYPHPYSIYLKGTIPIGEDEGISVKDVMPTNSELRCLKLGVDCKEAAVLYGLYGDCISMFRNFVLQYL